MNSRKYYVYCFVPGCPSTTAKTPNKLFFAVPLGKLRKKWCKMVRRAPDLSLTSSRFCCEDHFNVEEDVEDWMRYKILSAAGQPTFKLKLKRNVLPHKFDCQPDHKTAHSKGTRTAVTKQQSKELVLEAFHHINPLEAAEKVQDPVFYISPSSPISETEPRDSAAVCSTPKADSSKISFAESFLNSSTEVLSPCRSTHVQASGRTLSSAQSTLSSQERQNAEDVPEKESASVSCISPSAPISDAHTTDSTTNSKTPSTTTSISSFPDSFFNSLTELPSFSSSSIDGASAQSLHSTQTTMSSKGIQVKFRTKFRSIRTQCAPVTTSTGVQTLPWTIDSMSEDEHAAPLDALHSSSGLDSSFCPDSLSCPDSSFCLEKCDEEKSTTHALPASARQELLKFNITLMEKKCRRYLGLDPHNLHLVSLIEKQSNIDKIKIFMVLRKVRMSEPNDVLGDVFGLTASGVSRAISKNLPKIASFLEKFIFWPSKKFIRRNLPIAFRANYSKVQSIIDCFEIEIEQPTRATHQALTWSEYKKCNTLKYLISSTPDGFINYVSTGYGGRASDAEIIKDCDFLEKLQAHTWVMADRGFKQIESLLMTKKCSLVRPPSVSSGAIMTEAEVRQTKIIASLRIHIERVIKRVRDYSFLSAHSRFHHSLISIIDDVVIIACALSNCQSTLVPT